MLGFDFGEKRIGVAVGDTALGVAHPLTTIALDSKAARFAAIAELVGQWHPVQLVVGLPLHMDGTPNPRTAQARRFADQLGGRFGLPVALVDERLTSWDADHELVRAGVTGARRKAARDQVAAKFILESYFENHAARS